MTGGTLALGATYPFSTSALRVQGKIIAKNVLVYTNAVVYAVVYPKLAINTNISSLMSSLEANTYLLSTALSSANNPGVTYPARLCAEVVSGVGTGNIIICPAPYDSLGFANVTVTLSAVPPSAGAQNAAELTWTITGSPDSCTASGGWSGSKAEANGTHDEVVINLPDGNTTFTITCSKTDFADVAASTTVTVALPLDVSLSVSDNDILTTESTTFSWATTGSPDSCTGSYVPNYSGNPWYGAKNKNGDISPPYTGSSLKNGQTTQTAQKTYTITCYKAGATPSSASVDVTVSTAPVISFSFSPASPISTSNSTILTWAITGGTPDDCTASGDWSGSKSISGGTQTLSGLSAGTKTYTLSCTKNGNTVSNTATLEVVPPAMTVTLSASPTEILTTESTTLTWTTTGNPTSCNATTSSTGTGISNADTPATNDDYPWNFGNKLDTAFYPGGNQTLSGLTLGTKTYTITCLKSGYANVTATTTVNVVPFKVLLSASPNPATAGGSATITWSTPGSQQPDFCTTNGSTKAGGGSVPFWTGPKNPGSHSSPASSLSISDSPYTLKLTCSKTGGYSTTTTTTLEVQ